MKISYIRDINYRSAPEMKQIVKELLNKNGITLMHNTAKTLEEFTFHTNTVV